MGTREILFCVSIDTECDHTPKWTKAAPVTFHSVRDSLRQKLQPLFQAYGVRPTYLVTSEVLEDEVSANALMRLMGECEFGTHLHPEYVPPYRKYQDPSGTMSKEFLSNLPPEVQHAKVESISRLFRDTLGRAPRSFRAGRYGASTATLKILHELGYRVDTSVTPGIKWTGESGLLDFSKAPLQPYLPASTNISERGSLPILEVPITIGHLSLGKWLRRRLRGQSLIKLPVLRFLCRPLWLRPSLSTANEMIALVRALAQAHVGTSPLVLNMMFHSMELVPNASPYTKSEEDVQRFLKRMELVFRYCLNRWDTTFITLSDISSYHSA